LPDCGLRSVRLVALWTQGRDAREQPAGGRELQLGPCVDGEFSDPADIGQLCELDPAELLADLWAGEFEEPEDQPGEDLDDEFQAMIAPFSREFPGLAPAADQRLISREIEQALRSLRPTRIGLAAASRPADVLPLIGWDGAANHWEDALVIAAVLRSWEDRFGARLLRVGFAEIQLLAERPPRALRAAQHLAAEQFAFCDECAGTGLHDVSSITAHLLDSPIWTFWGD
jgi:hypothetical protein